MRLILICLAEPHYKIIRLPTVKAGMNRVSTILEVLWQHKFISINKKTPTHNIQ